MNNRVRECNLHTDYDTFTGRGLIVLPYSAKTDERDILDIAVGRICECGGDFDVIHGHIPENTGGAYNLTIILGQPESFKEFDEFGKIWNDTVERINDSYIVRTIRKSPVTVAVTGANHRGTLYAAYFFADLLKSGNEVQNIDIYMKPVITDRCAVLTGCTYAGRYFRPELFYKTLHELPRYGYNGVTLAPGGQSGVPVDRNGSPLWITDNGGIIKDRYIMAEWKMLFGNIKKYGMELVLSIPPLLPPNFNDGEVDLFYNGGKEPEGYIPALMSFFEEFLECILSTYKEIDMLSFSSTEGAEYGKSKRFFLAPEDVENNSGLLSLYLKNNSSIAKAYFSVLDRICRKYGVKAGFMTHIWGIVSPGLRELREALSEYPEIINIEDDYWNNNMWIYDIPVMNYLPEDIRAIVPERNSFALMQWCTDAEYYGGGSLPNAYPDTMIFSAREAVKYGAHMLVQRLNLHDRTVTGTLFGSVEIIPFAVSRQLWEPVKTTDELWIEWGERRYGKKASGDVIKALKNSKDIILKSFQANGVYLLLHSAINALQWTPGSICFNLFGKPGRVFVPKSHGDVIYSGEYFMFQMKSAAIPIKEFRKNQEDAIKQTTVSLEHIEKARKHLYEEDYLDLLQIFKDGDIVIRALMLLGEAAYASNLVLENYDRVENPGELLDKALADLESFNETVVKDRGENLLYPSAYGNIRQIAESYRKLI